MPTTDLEQRLETVEVRLMHLEAALDEATHALLQQEQLTRAQAAVIERLEDQLRTLAAGYPAGTDPEPPPPHY